MVGCSKERCKGFFNNYSVSTHKTGQHLTTVHSIATPQFRLGNRTSKVSVLHGIPFSLTQSERRISVIMAI